MNFKSSLQELIGWGMKDGVCYLENYNGSKERQTGSKEKTQFSNTKMRVLQKNIIILHLMVDAATNCTHDVIV